MDFFDIFFLNVSGLYLHIDMTISFTPFLAHETRSRLEQDWKNSLDNNRPMQRALLCLLSLSTG